jgi:membrane protein implicated in regulation of membrane protease activity
LTDARTLGRYLLFQLPGWTVAALLATVAVEWSLVSAPVAWGCVALWVAKDAALYRFVRRAYDRSGPTHGHVGERGVAEGAIDPEGWVRVGPELWRARRRRDAAPIAAGRAVRVVAVDGLELVVEPLDPAP